MYGAQTIKIQHTLDTWFENDVEMYGAQTLPNSSTIALLFENDVEMYGAQTYYSLIYGHCRLRMM